MPELTRDALFEALRRRRHYGTTGTRLFLDLHGWFAQPVAVFAEDPLIADQHQAPVREALMGDIIRPEGVPMRLAGEIIGTAPIERVDIMHGTEIAETVRPYGTAELGRRIRILWQGAEYRGRGRETLWQGKVTVAGNRVSRFEPVNFLNPERQVREITSGVMFEFNSVTTGNLAGIDLWMEEERRGSLRIETNVVSGEVDLRALAEQTAKFDAGGLNRTISVYRLPEQDWSRHVKFDHSVSFTGGSDVPVYVRITQSDGHQAWSSPIYLIG